MDSKTQIFSSFERLVYHGSNCVVQCPKVLAQGYTKDFGYAFYCTDLLSQAKKWALTRNGSSVVNKYSYVADDSLSVLTFSEMTEEWLDFLVACRRGVEHTFDVVEGPMGDDQIWDYVEDFSAGRISRAAFWELAKFKHTTHQIAFCTDKSLTCLTFQGVLYV